MNGEGLINLKNQTLPELEALLAPLGVPTAQARQIHARVFLRNQSELWGMTGLSRRRYEVLQQHTYIPRLEVVGSTRSNLDGCIRFLFRTFDGHLVESVRIPLLANRYTICVSSQVGCALGCTFCATGKLGFKRNLEPWEIVDQVLQAGAGADRPVTGALFMGQGEPFLNYEHVIKAANIMREPTGCQIRGGNISISTAGITPAIHRYTAEGHGFRLIVSLSAGTSETRRVIMPIERKYPLPELVAAISEYARVRKTRATIAWVALEGVNTSEAELMSLKHLLDGTPTIFNLIEVNDPDGAFEAPVGEGWRAFVDRLQLLKIPIVRRYTTGRDVSAACGMLASRAIEAGANLEVRHEGQDVSGVERGDST